ncbi:MAG: PIG-L family deacetylase, partial [bacterium]
THDSQGPWLVMRRGPARVPVPRWRRVLGWTAVAGVIGGAVWAYLAYSPFRINASSEYPPTIMAELVPGERILIVVPHPDDEMLGCGGLIQDAVSAGADLHVCVLTNGEYPELDAIVFEKTLTPKPAQYIALGYRRQQETLAAMTALGIPPDHVSFLGYPNGLLSSMWSAAHWDRNDPVYSPRTQQSTVPYRNARSVDGPCTGSALLADLAGVLRETQPELIVTMNPHDVHIDHWPAYAFVDQALSQLAANGFGFAQRCRVVTFLVHYPGWPTPHDYQPLANLDPPVPLLSSGDIRWEALPLTLQQVVAKHRLLGLYRTQEGALDPLIQSFARANELFGNQSAVAMPIAGTGEELLQVLSDPRRDEPAPIDHPAADLVGMEVGIGGRQLQVEVQTAAPVRPGVTYHVTLVAIRPLQPPILIDLDWGLDHSITTWRSDDLPEQLINDPASQVTVAAGGFLWTLDADRVEGPLSTILLHAETHAGAVRQDQTGIATLRWAPLPWIWPPLEFDAVP